MTAEPTPLKARAFLAGPAGGDTAVVLARMLSERGVADAALQGVRRLSGSALRAVDREIATVADNLLQLDLGDAVVTAWRKHAALTDAAERTLAVPGTQEVVALATHRITSTYAPHVDLFVDNVKVNSFEFRLTLVFDLTGVNAVLHAGDLVALRGGECVLTATLTLEDAQLAERQAAVDLPWLLPLRKPCPLVDSPATGASVPGQSTGQEAEPTPA